MKKKIFGILICITLLVTSVIPTLIIPEKSFVEADFGDEGTDGDTGLDLDYIWYKLENFSDVIYNAYPLNSIPKGRSFNSMGGDYTLSFLWNETTNMGLENVKIEQLQTIDIEHNNYSSIINLSNFEITFHTQQGATTYPFANPIPKTEMYIIPHNQMCIFKSMKKVKWTGNYSFNETQQTTKILPVDFEKLVDPIGETQCSKYSIEDDDYEWLTHETLFMVGSGEYLAPDDSVSEVDLLTVFIIDDAEGAQGKTMRIAYPNRSRAPGHYGDAN